jgi:acylglycerol lipase
MPFTPEHDELTTRSSLRCEKMYLRTKHNHFAHVTVWKPLDVEVKGIVVYAHGYGDHGNSSIFQSCSDKLVDSGFIIVAPDMPGHGKSTGIHGNFNSIDELVAAVDAAIDNIRRTEGFSLPLYLFGASLGGTTVLTYALRHPQKIDGAAVACPLIRPHETTKPGWFIVKAAQFLHSLIPWLPTAEGGNGKLCKDRSLEETWHRDELVYSGGMRVAAGLAMKHATEFLQQNIHRLSVPLFVQHGDADLVVDPAGSRELYERANTADKSIKMYPDRHHGFYIEEGYQAVLGDLIDWLTVRATRSASSSLPSYSRSSGGL